MPTLYDIMVCMVSYLFSANYSLYINGNLHHTVGVFWKKMDYNLLNAKACGGYILESEMLNLPKRIWDIVV